MELPALRQEMGNMSLLSPSGDTGKGSGGKGEKAFCTCEREICKHSESRRKGSSVPWAGHRPQSPSPLAEHLVTDGPSSPESAPPEGRQRCPLCLLPGQEAAPSAWALTLRWCPDVPGSPMGPEHPGRRHGGPLSKSTFKPFTEVPCLQTHTHTCAHVCTCLHSCTHIASHTCATFTHSLCVYTQTPTHVQPSHALCVPQTHTRVHAFTTLCAHSDTHTHVHIYTTHSLGETWEDEFLKST